jgi:peptidoglycan/LPS O-acetylase OafA/YrhL
MASVAPPFPRKVEWLDGLRGVAALAVLLAHIRNLVLPDVMFAQYVPLGHWIERSQLMIVTAGNLAVRIFFIHSGFVLSWKYLNRPDLRIILSMALRRAFRLGIPIAVAILFAFALMRLQLMRNVEMGAVTHAAAPLVLHYRFEPTLASAVSDMSGGWFVHESVRYDGALWTMPIELICSYVVFLVLPVLALSSSAVPALVALAASFIVFGSYPWVAYFMAGVLFVRLYRSFPEIPAIAAWPLLLVAITAGVFVAAEPVQFLSSLLIVGLLFTHERWRRFLQRPATQFLGRTSFSVYLIHIPLLCSFSSALFLALHRLGVPHLANALATASVTIALAYALAWAMWRWIDRFAINFGKAAIDGYLYRAGSSFAVTT